MTTTTIACISTADIAKAKVVPALLSVSYISLVAVSSRDKQKAQQFVDENCSNDTNKCVGMTHDEVLEDKDIDAVYVPLPSKVRNAFIIKALNNNKHIYSEKPFGGTVNELKSILNMSSKLNLQWIDGTMWYHSIRTKEMEKILYNSDKLGKVKRVSASFTWGGGGLVDEAWVEGGNGRTDPNQQPMGMLGDSGHYPISACLWAFNWQLPTKVCATYTKFNSVGAIVECEAVLWFKDGGRAIIDTSCLLPHRSQFEVVCEKGVLKVDDLVGGQGRSGNFSEAYDHPYVGSKSYVLGDYLGKDEVVEVEQCDHVQKLVEQFSNDIQVVKEGGKANQEWSKRSIMTHTVMCAIFESAMRDGRDVKLLVVGDATTRYEIGDETYIYTDMPSRNWAQ